MNRFLSLAIVVGTVLVAAQVFAANPGDICTLGDSVKVFAKPDRKGSGLKMTRGQKLKLIADADGQLQVDNLEGKTGFAKKSWLMKICKWKKPATQPPLQVVPVAPPPTTKKRDLQSQLAINQIAVARAATSARGTALPDPRITIQVAVYDLKRTNIPTGIGRIVTSSLLSEVRKLEGVSAIGMEEIKAMLSHEATKQLVGCVDSSSCVAEIAGALGVAEIITGELTEAADGRIISIRRINQREAKVITTYENRLKIGSGEEFLAAIGPSLETLYPKRKVRPGTQRGVAKEVALRLNPPPIAPWVTYTVGAASLTAGIVGGTMGYFSQQYASQYNTTPEGEGPFMASDWQDYQRKTEQMALGSNISLVTAGACAISAAVMYFFTDWQGHSEDDAQ